MLTLHPWNCRIVLDDAVSSTIILTFMGDLLYFNIPRVMREWGNESFCFISQRYPTSIKAGLGDYTRVEYLQYMFSVFICLCMLNTFSFKIYPGYLFRAIFLWNDKLQLLFYYTSAGTYINNILWVAVSKTFSPVFCFIVTQMLLWNHSILHHMTKQWYIFINLVTQGIDSIYFEFKLLDILNINEWSL